MHLLYLIKSNLFKFELERDELVKQINLFNKIHWMSV